MALSVVHSEVLIIVSPRAQSFSLSPSPRCIIKAKSVCLKWVWSYPWTRFQLYYIIIQSCNVYVPNGSEHLLGLFTVTLLFKSYFRARLHATLVSCLWSLQINQQNIKCNVRVTDFFTVNRNRPIYLPQARQMVAIDDDVLVTGDRNSMCFFIRLHFIIVTSVVILLILLTGYRRREDKVNIVYVIMRL